MSAHGYDERGLPEGYNFHPEWEAAPREVKEAIDDPGRAPLIIDCRQPEEREFTHIDGSVLIPLGELPARLDEIEAPEGGEVYVHCRSGHRSLKAAAILRHAGISGAKSIAGGIRAWSGAIDSSVPMQP